MESARKIKIIEIGLIVGIIPFGLVLILSIAQFIFNKLLGHAGVGDSLLTVMAMTACYFLSFVILIPALCWLLKLTIKDKFLRSRNVSTLSGISVFVLMSPVLFVLSIYLYHWKTFI